MDIIVIGHRLLMVCAWLGGTIPMGLEPSWSIFRDDFIDFTH